MLQSIREHTQGWISGVIITIIIISFAFWGIHSYFIGNAASTDVAVVNGEPISKIQFSNAYENIKRQYQEQFGANNPFAGKEDLLKRIALRSVIEADVLKQTAMSENFHISDDQITQVLQTIPNFPLDTQLSGDQFQRIYDTLLINQPRSGIIATSFSLPDEILGMISLLHQQRDYDYLQISNSFFVSQPSTIGDDKIQAYYDAHKKDFMTTEQVSIEYLQLTSKDVSEALKPSDEELKSYYSDNQDSYQLPAQWKLQSIEIPLTNNATDADVKTAEDKANADYQALVKGDDFAKVAMGNMGTLNAKEWVVLSKVPTEYQKAVAALNNVNEVTHPFRTSKGYVVIKAVAVVPAKPQAFADVKQAVTESYIREKAESKLADMRDRLADTTYERPDTLDAAAKELNLTVKNTGLFSRDAGSDTDISSDKRVRDVAFSTDVLKNQNNSDVIQISPDNIVVIREKSYVPAKLLPLAEVKSKIEDILKQQDSTVRSEKLAQDLLQQLDGGGDAQQLAKNNKLSWTTVGSSTRFDNKVEAAIAETAFRLSDPSKNNKKATYGLARLPDGFAIVRLVSIKTGTMDDKKQYSIFSEQIQNDAGTLEYELYKQSAVNDAKIVIK